MKFLTDIFTSKVSGGAAASGTLTLQSTSSATKGKIVMGTSAYDEVNNRLGIGTAAPSQALEIIGNIFANAAGTALNIISRGAITNFAGFQWMTASVAKWTFGTRNDSTENLQLYNDTLGTVALMVRATDNELVLFQEVNLVTGTTTMAPIKFIAGPVLTTPATGVEEYDGTMFAQTVDTTSGRAQNVATHQFRLTANGAAIGPTIANFFGANSAFPTVAGAVYEIIYHLSFLKNTTAGTNVYTLTNTTTYTNMVANYIQNAIAGIQTQAAPASAGIVTTTIAAAALPATGLLAISVNHQVTIRAVVEIALAGNIRLNVTQSFGTITPLRGSYYTVRRLFAGNVGTFAA